MVNIPIENSSEMAIKIMPIMEPIINLTMPMNDADNDDDVDVIH